MNRLSFKDVSFCVDSRYPGLYIWFTLNNRLYHFSIGGARVIPQLKYPFKLSTNYGMALILSPSRAWVWGEEYGSF